MITVSELKEIENFPGRITIKGAGGLTLSSIEPLLIKTLQKYGVPFTVSSDQVQSGGLFKKSYEDCLCISNPEHQTDYFKYCIRLSVTGTVAFVTINYYGQSKLTGQKHIEQERKNSGSLGKMALGAIFKTDQQAFDAEYQYYDIIDSGIKEVFGV